MLEGPVSAGCQVSRYSTSSNYDEFFEGIVLWPKGGLRGVQSISHHAKTKVGRWPWLDMTLLRKKDEISRKQKWPSSREPYQAQSPCALEHGSLGLGWRLAAFALWSLLPDACNSFHSSCTCTTWQADSAVEAFGDGLEAFHCALQILRRSGILVGEVTSSSVPEGVSSASVSKTPLPVQQPVQGGIGSATV